MSTKSDTHEQELSDIRDLVRVASERAKWLEEDMVVYLLQMAIEEMTLQLERPKGHNH